MIFFSHSHKDMELTIAIIGMLKEKFNLNDFIDSQIWGYIYKLQKEIDNKYCMIKDTENSYDYDKRNLSTSHVHLMLNNALRKMIDSCNFFFFLDSENSLRYDSIDDKEITNTIRISNLKEIKLFDESSHIGNENISFIYAPNFNNFFSLRYSEIKKIKENKNEFLRQLIL